MEDTISPSLRSGVSWCILDPLSCPSRPCVSHCHNRFFIPSQHFPRFSFRFLFLHSVPHVLMISLIDGLAHTGFVIDLSWRADDMVLVTATASGCVTQWAAPVCRMLRVTEGERRKAQQRDSGLHSSLSASSITFSPVVSSFQSFARSEEHVDAAEQFTACTIGLTLPSAEQQFDSSSSPASCASSSSIAASSATEGIHHSARNMTARSSASSNNNTSNPSNSNSIGDSESPTQWSMACASRSLVKAAQSPLSDRTRPPSRHGPSAASNSPRIHYELRYMNAIDTNRELRDSGLGRPFLQLSVPEEISALLPVGVACAVRVPIKSDSISQHPHFSLTTPFSSPSDPSAPFVTVNLNEEANAGTTSALLAGCGDGCVRVFPWPLVDNVPRLTLPLHSGPILALRYSPSSGCIVTAGDDGSIFVRKLSKALLQLQSAGQVLVVFLLCFSPRVCAFIHSFMFFFRFLA